MKNIRTFFMFIVLSFFVPKVFGALAKDIEEQTDQADMEEMSEADQEQARLELIFTARRILGKIKVKELCGGNPTLLKQFEYADEFYTQSRAEINTNSSCNSLSTDSGDNDPNEPLLAQQPITQRRSNNTCFAALSICCSEFNAFLVNLLATLEEAQDEEEKPKTP